MRAADPHSKEQREDDPENQGLAVVVERIHGGGSLEKYGPKSIQVLVLAGSGRWMAGLKNRPRPPIIQRGDASADAGRRGGRYDIIAPCGKMTRSWTGRNGRPLPASTSAPWMPRGIAPGACERARRSGSGSR